MTFPSAPGFSKTNADQPADLLSLARVDVHNLMVDVEDIIAARGQVNGIAALDATTKVPVAQLPVNIPNGIAGLTAAGLLSPLIVPRSAIVPAVWSQTTPGDYSFVVPADTFWLYVEAWGGGGGGGYSNSFEHAGGGGAGGGAISYWPVQPGDTLSIHVGRGGNGGANTGDNDGEDAEDTTVTHDGSAVVMLAMRGFGGHSVTTKAGGDGGYATGFAQVKYYGGVGATGIQQGTASPKGCGGLGGSNARSGSGPIGTSFSNVGWGGGGYGSGTGGPVGDPQKGNSGGVLIVC